MDYIFTFGPIEKIYRVDDTGISECKRSRGSVVPTITIAWPSVLGAGEGVMTSSAYEKSREVGRTVSDAIIAIAPPRHPAGYRKVMDAMEYMNAFVSVTYDASGKKKFRTLLMNGSSPDRSAFINDLSNRLGSRWVGEGRDPEELKSTLGIPRQGWRSVLVYAYTFVVAAVCIAIIYFIKFYLPARLAGR